MGAKKFTVRKALLGGRGPILERRSHPGHSQPRQEAVLASAAGTDDPPAHRPVGSLIQQAATTEKGVGTCNDLGYNASVPIKRFRHKGLEQFFTNGSQSGIQAKHAERLRLILGRLNVATAPRDMNLPGLELHELHGRRKGTWAVKVSGNWRVTFAFAGTDADRVDYEDYH